MSFQLDAALTREALLSLPEVAAQEGLTPPELGRIYIPAAHRKALSIENSIVVGMRGAGKSFWTAALADPHLRTHIARNARVPALASVEVRIGFGEDQTNSNFPNESQLRKLRQAKIEPYTIWLTVVLRHALRLLNIEHPLPESVLDAIGWVEANYTEAESLLTKSDDLLSHRGIRLLVIFDALDRLASDWEGIREYLRSALKFCLDCRSRNAIRLKFFLRPDMFDDDSIWNFVDSSKLNHTKIQLTWRPGDLYGLILHHIANHPEAGAHFRQQTTQHFEAEWQPDQQSYDLPEKITQNEDSTRTIVEAITGKYMGANAKRGYSFTWIPLHLSDANGNVSPRTFIVVFREAAEFTVQSHASHGFPLHYKGIEQGVRKASKFRVDELQEDYPWIRPLLNAANGLIVPCDASELIRRWDSSVLSRINRGSAKLLPRQFKASEPEKLKHQALLNGLRELAVIYRSGKRINIPDIFRVEAGIKRKGGVRPVQ